MTPYDRAWDMGSYTEYMWSYDGICQVVRIPDEWPGRLRAESAATARGQARLLSPGPPEESESDSEPVREVPLARSGCHCQADSVTHRAAP
jgi:hypothetical protein